MTVETPIFDYPFVKGEKGFSFEELFKRKANGENTGTIFTESGEELEYDISNSVLTIMDLRTEEFMLSSRNTYGTTSFSLRTRSRHDREKHHPDLFAKKFVKCAIEYFKANGRETNVCVGEWHAGSDNFETFINEYNKHKNSVEAAKATWSGKVFVELGYTKVDMVHIDLLENGYSYYASAMFSKE